MRHQQLLWVSLVAMAAGFGAGIGGTMIVLAEGRGSPVATPRSTAVTERTAAGNNDRDNRDNRDDVVTLLRDIRASLERDRIGPADGTSGAPLVYSTDATDVTGGPELSGIEAKLERLVELAESQPRDDESVVRRSRPAGSVDQPGNAGQRERTWTHLRTARLARLLARPDQGDAATVRREIAYVEDLLSGDYGGASSIEAYDLLRSALGHPDAAVVVRALSALYEYEAAPPVSELMPLLSDSNEKVRQRALSVMGFCAGHDAVQLLLGHTPATSDEDDYTIALENMLDWARDEWPDDLIAAVEQRIDLFSD